MKPKICCSDTKSFKTNCKPQLIVASKDHVNAFKALAHLGRLQVFFLLVDADEPLPANELQAKLKIPAPTLSHYLNELERAGLIERIRQERFILSSVRRDRVLELVRILTACC